MEASFFWDLLEQTYQPVHQAFPENHAVADIDLG